jgi:hypothetical protein
VAVSCLAEKIVSIFPADVIVAIGLRKSIAKTEVGKSCTCMMFIGSC